MDIPENITDFLYWIRDRTEKFWSDERAAQKWYYGARWLPLTEKEIAGIELEYNIQFSPEHREFLKILHAVDRKETVEYEYDDEKFSEECTFFYNWKEDREEILEIITYPYDSMLKDMESAGKCWLRSWGPEPESEEERKGIFQEWFSAIPDLIPVRGIYFMVSGEHLAWNPVLCISGFDMGIMGWDMKAYLLSELRDYIGIVGAVFDEEDRMYYPELCREATDIIEKNFQHDETKDIPYLKEVVLFYASGRRYFGLK